MSAVRLIKSPEAKRKAVTSEEVRKSARLAIGAINKWLRDMAEFESASKKRCKD